MLIKESNPWTMDSSEPEKILSKWQQQKEILREKFKRLSDQDLNFEEHRKAEMMGRLAHKLGMTTREIERIINQIL
jgi:hypothetical protein